MLVVFLSLLRNLRSQLETIMHVNWHKTVKILLMAASVLKNAPRARLEAQKARGGAAIHCVLLVRRIGAKNAPPRRIRRKKRTLRRIRRAPS